MTEPLTQQQQFRRALLDSAAEDYAQVLDSLPPAAPSRSYRRWRKRMIRNPRAFLPGRRPRRPWLQALRGAACQASPFLF